MADSKISQLEPAVILNPQDQFIIVQGATNKKVTTEVMFGNIATEVVVDADFTAVDNSNNVYFSLDQQTGNVGIGTDLPSTDLHIVGELFLSGNLTKNIPTTATSAAEINSTILVNDIVFVDTTAGTINVTLPSASSGVSTKTLSKEFFKKAGSNTLTINTGNLTTDYPATVTLQNNGDCVKFNSDGTNWYVSSIQSRATTPVTYVSA